MNLINILSTDGRSVKKKDEECVAREVKEYDERLKEILTTARELFFTKGYDATSINDIISAIGIAKGTFYHYFDSKEDLIVALADQITDEAVAIIKSITDDPSLGAREKFQQVFAQTGSWKVDNKEMMLELLQVMYDPNNTRLFKTLNTLTLTKATPYFARIIKQGIAEDEWNTRYPDEMARILFHMGFGISEQFRTGFLNLMQAPEEDKQDILEDLRQKIEAYEYAISRLVGAETDSLDLINFDLVDAFFGDV